MILADSSVWIDHFRRRNPLILELAASKRLCVHAYVIGELALGSLRDRQATLRDLHRLVRAPIAEPEEVLSLIEAAKLFSRGLGYVDTHLLASALLLPGCRLWTRDRRLLAAAQGLGIAA